MRRETKEYPHGFRIQGLVLRDDDVLLVHRINHGHEYYLLPGGGWEDEETREEGIRREVKEETSMDVEVLKPLFVCTITGDSQHWVYLCKYVRGEPRLGDANELRDMKNDPENYYEPIWFPIAELANVTMYQLEFRDWFLANREQLNNLSSPFEITTTLERLRH